MEHSKWKLLVDKRFKYTGVDPQWHMVSIKEPSEDIPLKDQPKYHNCVLSARYKVYLPLISNYDVRSDDIWITTYPRSGTTWTQEMVWLINNDYDFQTAQTYSLLSRSPTIRNLISDKTEVNQTAYDAFIDVKKKFGPPYHIKNHLPAPFLPKKIWTVKPKIIYVARNPKDQAISFYHFYKSVYQYDGTMEEFLNLWLEGLTEFGQQTRHILEFWNLRHEENVLFLTFEEMKTDLKTVIKRVAAFLGKTITSDQLEQLNEFLQFSSMRERTDGGLLSNEVPTQVLFRQGKCGAYKDEMSSEIIQKFNELIDTELTKKGCDIYA